MDLVKISIITASFKSEKTIADCIDSVLNQSYKNIEYIIIDGGSTDKTIDIIKNYEPLFCGRLKWISEADKGIYDAWNKGIKLSTGDWISFIGSDDILLESAMTDYTNIIQNNPDINYISSNVLQVTASLEPIRLVGEPWSDKMRTSCCISHVGSLHHKSLFQQIGLFNTDYYIAGDYDFLLRSYEIINPYYISILTAKTRMGGISDGKIFTVAGEVLETKTKNRSRPVVLCLYDYCIMIFKYYFRRLINFFSLARKPIYK
jgi:glycosyltransferase involved in cell wall biosynthesis